MRPQERQIGTFVAALLVGLCARDGAAQSSGAAKPWFVGASVGGNIDNTTWRFSSSEKSGGALAVGVTAGRSLAGRWSLQVEGEWPTSDMVIEDSYGSGTHVMRSTLRTPTVAVLFGVHWRLPKGVDVAFQFGPTVLNQQWNDEQQELVNGTVVDSHQSSRSQWYLRPAVGVRSMSQTNGCAALVLLGVRAGDGQARDQAQEVLWGLEVAKSSGWTSIG